MTRPVRKRPGTPRKGRAITVPRTIVTARDIMRRHLREEGWQMQQLGEHWNVLPGSVKFIFWKKTPLPPQYIDAFITALRLDEFDALELRLQAAIEAGWQLLPLKEKLL